MDPILEGLRKAGLSIPENESSDSPRRSEAITAKADRAKSGTAEPVVDSSTAAFFLPENSSRNSSVIFLATALLMVSANEGDAVALG